MQTPKPRSLHRRTDSGSSVAIDMEPISRGSSPGARDVEAAHAAPQKKKQHQHRKSAIVTTSSPRSIPPVSKKKRQSAIVTSMSPPTNIGRHSDDSVDSSGASPTRSDAQSASEVTAEELSSVMPSLAMVERSVSLPVSPKVRMVHFEDEVFVTPEPSSTTEEALSPSSSVGDHEHKDAGAPVVGDDTDDSARDTPQSTAPAPKDGDSSNVAEESTAPLLSNVAEEESTAPLLSEAEKESILGSDSVELRRPSKKPHQ